MTHVLFWTKVSIVALLTVVLRVFTAAGAAFGFGVLVGVAWSAMELVHRYLVLVLS